MDWDAIGAVGEMIGALAVVATLAYLALQIRASTRESEANQWTITGRDGNDLASQFMQYAEVWTKGNEGDELTRSERFVFQQLVEIKNNYHFFTFGRRTMLGGTVYQGVHVAAMAHFLHRHPAAYAYWRDELGTGGEAVGADWTRQVSEAVAALEMVEET